MNIEEISIPPPLTMYSRWGGLMWLDHERQRLYNSYGKQSKETLQRLFPDRTWQSLNTKASRLKIPRPNKRFTENEDALLLELKQEGRSYKDIMEFFDYRTEQSLRNRYYRLKKNGYKTVE